MKVRNSFARAVAAAICLTAAAAVAEEPAKGVDAAPRPEKWAVPMTRAGVPNLHKVSDKLYRSAQPTAEGMTNLVALGIKTVVNLRDNHSDSDEIGALHPQVRGAASQGQVESGEDSLRQVVTRHMFVH